MHTYACNMKAEDRHLWGERRLARQGWGITEGWYLGKYGGGTT